MADKTAAAKAPPAQKKSKLLDSGRIFSRTLAAIKDVIGYSLQVLGGTKTPFKFKTSITKDAVVFIEAPLGKDSKDATFKESQPRPRRDQFRVFDLQGQVLLYKSEPTVPDLIKARNCTVSDSYPALIPIPNGAIVKVLSDNGKESIRVAVMSGQFDGETGWICRSSIVTQTEVA